GSGAASSLWLGLDGFREPLLLAETPRGGAEPQPLAALAVLGAQLARLPATAVLSVCTDDAELSQQLRTLQRDERGASDAPEPPIGDTEAGEREALDPRLRAALVGTCLLRQTRLLLKRLLELAPAVVAVLQEATTLVCAVVNAPRGSAGLRAALLGLAEVGTNSNDGDSAGNGSARWSLPMRLVRGLVALEDDVRALWPQELSPRSAFWADLRQVDALLAPFSWAFALSESEAGDVTSAQFLLLWLWLLALVHAPPPSSSSATTLSFSAEQRAALTAATVAAIRAHVDDHQLASLLLDPRVHGAGLSATGRRKAKALVVQVAVRAFPAAGFHVVGSGPRAALLAQLGSYAEKAAQFADEVAWEMSAGQPAAAFWKDYAEDARELADVARAAVRFVPHVQSAGGGGVGTGGSLAAPEPGDREAFQVRQIKQLYQKTAGGPRASASAEAAVARYAALLLPVRRDSVATSCGAVRVPGGGDGAATAAHLLLAMTQQIEFMRSAGGSSVDGSASSSSTVQDAAAGERGEATPPGNIKRPALLAADESWFAFGGESERREIERALQRFASPAAALARRSSRK
ncbi:hypothetical protein PybrP1_011738, partial [[Pythium] brassicae (nom. inval.)]